MPHPESSPSEKSGAERRRWPRANADLPISIAIEGKNYEAKVRDVSRAGVCFYLERAIPLMTVLGLALDLQVGERVHHVRGKGAVVRCEKISPTLQHYEVAVFLHDLTESDREVIDLHVRARLSKA